MGDPTTHNGNNMLICGLAVVAVYGVLFLDWNTQGSPENPPFQGVRSRNLHMYLLVCADTRQIRNWFFGLTGNIWGRDEVRRPRGPDEASPVSSSGS